MKAECLLSKVYEQVQRLGSIGLVACDSLEGWYLLYCIIY